MRKKFLFIFIVSIVIILNLLIGNTYASELTELLNECKSDLGDLEEFKAVVELVYTDLDSAETLDDSLKTKLNNDIEKLDEVSGINKLASSILKQELKNKIATLTESNVESYKEELRTVIEWAEDEINSNNEENLEGEDSILIDDDMDDDMIIEDDDIDDDMIVEEDDIDEDIDEEINDNVVDEDIINEEQDKDQIITTVSESNTTSNKVETSTRQENISRTETKVSTENDELPYTGILNSKKILIIVSILIISILISVSKYRKYNGI